MTEKPEMDIKKEIPFEDALNQTGFGLYSYVHIGLSGLTIIAFTCVAYAATLIVPASACELDTTPTQQGVLASTPLVGSIIGAFAWGYLGDTRGRRSMLLLSILLSTILNILVSFSVSWIMLMIVQFFAASMATGMYSLSITLLSECVPMARRNVVLLLVSSIFLLAQGIMAVMAIPIIPLTFSYYWPSLGIYWNSWRTLVLVFSVPNIICFVGLYFMHESPKFLLVKGEDDKALEVLRSIYSWNNRNKVEEYKPTKIVPEQSVTSDKKSSAKDQIVPLFKGPLLKNTLIMATLYIFQQIVSFMVWLPTITNQFVEIFRTGEGSDLTLCKILQEALDAPADPDAIPCSINLTALLMVLGVGAMQSVVNILMSTVVNITGRRNMAMVVTATCGVAGILINLVPNAIGSAFLFAVFLLAITMLGVYSAMSVALFPTHLRAMAVSLTVSLGRVGTFASVQILNYLLRNNCEVGFYVYASILASSAVVASFLPDDRLLLRPPPPKKEEEQL